MTVTCPVCGAMDPIDLDRRARVPVLQNRVWPDRATARAASDGKLDIKACAGCGFVWNQAFDPARIVYDESYEIDQTVSQRFREYMADAARRVIDQIPKSRTVHLVEVGCGQGKFLAELACAAKDRFSSLTGFDPAWRGQERAIPDGITVHRRLFERRTTHLVPGSVEFVVSRHSIEHIPHPLAFLRALRDTIQETADARLFLETPDSEWIVRNFQPQDLFYEHCSLFSKTALAVALAKTGFEPLAIDYVFGDQYLWAEARIAQRDAMPAVWSGWSEARQFAERSAHFVRGWRSFIESCVKGGPVWLWGGSSKGVTFALLIDPPGDLLAGVIDINPNKVGQFLPITGLPIAAPEALPSGATVIVMNPNYRDEIAAEIARMGKIVRLLSIDDDI